MENREDRIRVRAFFIWLNSKKTLSDIECWREAEKIEEILVDVGVYSRNDEM